MGKEEITHEEMIFRDEIGQKATVSREELGPEAAENPNRKLCELGIGLNPKPETLEYKGSAAVHIYQSPILKQLFFVSQTQPLDLYRCPEMLATKAFDDLLGTLKEMYGRKRPKLRSGF
jgi:hypothetical protein